MSGNYNNNNGRGNQNNNNNNRGSAVLGAVAGTGFRSMAAALARNRRRGGRDRDSDDDDYFENPNRLNNRRKNNKMNKRNQSNNTRTSSRAARQSQHSGRRSDQRSTTTGRRTNRSSILGDRSSVMSSRASRHLSANTASTRSRSSSPSSFVSSDDSHPGRSHQSRSVHSRSTFSRRSYTTQSSASGYSESSYNSDSYSHSDNSASEYSRTTGSTRSYSRSHATATTSATKTTFTTKQSTQATTTMKDGRSTTRGGTLHTITSGAPSVRLSSRRSVSASASAPRTGTLRRDRSTTGGSDADLQSYGARSSSDSGASSRSHSSRSARTPAARVRVNEQKLAIAAVLDGTAAGGFECLLEDPAKQQSSKRAKHKQTAGRYGRVSSSRRHGTVTGARSASRGASAPAGESNEDDDAKSVVARREHASSYRLNIPILQRFCTEFSTPLVFGTAEADVFLQQRANEAAGRFPVIAVDEATGVAANTKNAANASLMQSINKAVMFVISQAPQYPSEMVRAVLWRVVQSSKGPHDRLGAWKLTDGVLRLLHRRMNAFLKVEQGLKARESTIQQQRHVYEQNKAQRLIVPAEEDPDDVVADRQFYADISTALALLEAEQKAARDEIRWVKIMLSEFAQLLPYLILYCWGGEKASAFRTGGHSSRAAKSRLEQIQLSLATGKNQGAAATANSASGANSGTGNSVEGVPSNASDDAADSAAVMADLEVVKRRVLDFVAGRVHGDGSMTERGQHHHATLLRHHHALDSQAAATAVPKNTITTQSRFAVGNGMHLTTSKAKQLITDRELDIINDQIFAEYDTILRGWNVLFASDKFYISFVHLRRAVGDYAALLSDHDTAMGIRMGMQPKPSSRHREGSDLYHFALKASHLKQNAERSMSSQQLTDGIYHRQREVFEAFLLPPSRMVDALWRFRRADPRPSLVATVLTQYGVPVFKSGAAAANGSSGFGATSNELGGASAAGGGASSFSPSQQQQQQRSNSRPPRPEEAVAYVFPKSVAEVEAALGFAVNDRLAAWIKKAAEGCGGCVSCDSWSHTFNTCPYRPSRFVPSNRQIVASLTAAEAVELLKATAGRSYTDRSAAAAALAAFAGGGISAERAGSDATTAIGGMNLEQLGQARKQLVLDVLDAAVERASSGVEMDSILNALDVLLRQSSTGRERQALALLASYRLQPSKMLQFTNSASNSVAPVSRRGRRKQNQVDFSRSGRTAAAERLLAFLSEERRLYEAGRLRAAMETLYFRYMCIPPNDAVMSQQLQRDVQLIRENRCFIDVLADDEAPLHDRIFAVAPKSVLAAAVARTKRIAHLLDPCTLEVSACCSGAATDAVRAYWAQQGPREPMEATEPWDWYVARQVLKSERLISQHDGLATTLDDYQSKIQRTSELIERLNELADGHERRGTDGRVAASRLRLVAHIAGQFGFCTACNRFGHSRRTCAELASTIIRNNLSPNTRRELGITSLTTARIAASSMAAHIRTLQAGRHRYSEEHRAEVDKDIRSLTELIALLGGQQDTRGGGAYPLQHRALRVPAPVALVARRVGGVRSGQIDLGSTATAPALPPSISAAIKAITTHTGLSMAEVRFCPDECLALFHAASYHHLTPHIAAFRTRQFPNVVITTGQYEDDAFDDRALHDRAAGATVSSDLSSQTLAQLSNPLARRRNRAYALVPEHFSGIAVSFDSNGRSVLGSSVLTEGLSRALNAQQLCRDRYLDLSAFLVRTTGSGSIGADGCTDYETIYSLCHPQGQEARLVRQQLLSRGQALHEELSRRIQHRVPSVNPNVSFLQRPYHVVYELERDYFIRNLSAEADKAAYTFYAALQCRNNIAAILRRYTQERSVPVPKPMSSAIPTGGGAPMAPAPMLMLSASQLGPATVSQRAYSSAGSSSSYGAPNGGSQQQQHIGSVTLPNAGPSITFRGRLSSGICYTPTNTQQDATSSRGSQSQPATDDESAAAANPASSSSSYTGGRTSGVAPRPSSQSVGGGLLPLPTPLTATAASSTATAVTATTITTSSSAAVVGGVAAAAAPITSLPLPKAGGGFMRLPPRPTTTISATPSTTSATAEADAIVNAMVASNKIADIALDSADYNAAASKRSSVENSQHAVAEEDQQQQSVVGGKRARGSDKDGGEDVDNGEPVNTSRAHRSESA